jgi:hypothetical protein
MAEASTGMLNRNVNVDGTNAGQEESAKKIMRAFESGIKAHHHHRD